MDRENVTHRLCFSQRKADETDTPHYAFPCDNYIKVLFSNWPTRHLMQCIANKYFRPQIEKFIETATLVSAINFPRLASAMADCCGILAINRVPKIYVSDRLRGINAICISVHEEPAIVISSQACCLSDGEMRFLLGHELSHSCEDSSCHLVSCWISSTRRQHPLIGNMIHEMLFVHINEWCQSSEYTADRTGLICCKDIAYAHQLMKRIGYKEGQHKAIVDYGELYVTHPTIRHRMEQLKQYTLDN